MEGEHVIVMSLDVNVVKRGPITVDVTLQFRGNTNKRPLKTSHHQFFDLWTLPLEKDSE